MNDEILRLALIDIEKNNLLNDFVNNVFDYNFKENEYIYIQYKIVDDSIIFNMYDNKDSNRFKAYIFTKEDYPSNNDTYYINVNNSYINYINGSNNKLDLFSSLLISNDIKEKRKIINYLFTGKIKTIFNHYFL